MIEWTEVVTGEMVGQLDVGWNIDVCQWQMKWYDSMFNVDKMADT